MHVKPAAHAPMKAVVLLLPAAIALHAAAAAREPGAVFKDCPECPEMVVLPAGRFAMGAAPGEEEPWR
jgi:hypothetical protein